MPSPLTPNWNFKNHAIIQCGLQIPHHLFNRCNAVYVGLDMAPLNSFTVKADLDDLWLNKGMSPQWNGRQMLPLEEGLLTCPQPECLSHMEWPEASFSQSTAHRAQPPFQHLYPGSKARPRSVRQIFLFRKLISLPIPLSSEWLIL